MSKIQTDLVAGLKVRILVGLFWFSFLLVFFLVPPFDQDQGYYYFADDRPWLKIPNAFNVLSNLPFLLVGYLGLNFTHKFKKDKTKFIDQSEALAFYIAFAGIFLVALGSGWFHWMPNDWTLVPDRLPMTIGFMAILAIFISERINLRAGQTLLPVLLFIGVFSVGLWILGERVTDIIPADLRLYGLVQFFPIIALLIMLWWFPPRYTGVGYIYGIFVFYILAKGAEEFDCFIWKLTDQIISGHSLKHLLAALATYFLYLYIKNRKPN
ncbi:MAG: ceramidase domain-containing protein [Sphingomonadales bacterium]